VSFSGHETEYHAPLRFTFQAQAATTPPAAAALLLLHQDKGCHDLIIQVRHPFERTAPFGKEAVKFLCCRAARLLRAAAAAGARAALGRRRRR
jgi:hypothetical protein